MTWRKSPSLGVYPAGLLPRRSINLLFIYLFLQVHRIELTIFLNSWRTISSLVHARSFYYFVCPRHHPSPIPSFPTPHRHHSSVLNVCPSKSPFMRLFTYVYLWKIYGIDVLIYINSIVL